MFTRADGADLHGARRTRHWDHALRRLAVRFPPHIVFLLVGGINAILLAFLTPPFQVHDEFQHFFRSYQLSEGSLWGSVQDGHPGSVIPSSLPELVERTWGTLEIWRIPPLGTHPLAEAWHEFQQPLAPERRQFATFLTVDYSPLQYIPQTLGVAVGRLFGASPLALLLLGRLANAATAVVVIAWSLRVLPMGRAAALATALLPMAQFEYGSVAPDATIIASAFLLTAVALRASLRKTWPRTDVLISAVAAAIICSKVVYAPLLAIGLPALLYAGKSGTSRNTMARLLSAYLLIAAFAVGLAALWLASTTSTMASVMLPSGTVAASKAAILGEPLRFAEMLLMDIRLNGHQYFDEVIGILGAWTVYLPEYVYALAGFSLVLSCVLAGDNDPKLNTAAIIWNLCLIASVVSLLQTALFVMTAHSTPFWRISGVQGRYFLPLGALAAATFVSMAGMSRRQSGAAFGYVLLIAIIVFDTALMDATVVNGFHLFGPVTS